MKTQDDLINEWERSLGENDRYALYNKLGIPTHLRFLLKDLMNKWYWEVTSERARVKGAQFHKDLEKSISGEEKTLTPEMKGREEILRFVKYPENKPKVEGRYLVRGKWLFVTATWNGSCFVNNMKKEVNNIEEWLEIIPAKEEFNPQNVKITIGQYNISMIYKDREWKFTPGLNWMDQTCKSIKEGFDQIKKWHYETE